jgi:hypothetical protein
MTIAAFAGGSDDPAPADGPARATAAPHPGLAVWIEQGCGSCHTFKPAGSSAPIGPDLQQSLRSRSRNYILQSIVQPNAAAAPGYTIGAMPEDYGRRIDPQDLEPLVDFLFEGARQ